MSKHANPETSAQRQYVTGYLLSLVLTFIPFLLVIRDTVSGNALVATVLVFAVLQLYVQLRYFLHMGRDRGVRWQSTAFLFMLMVVGIIVFGSLWIMKNLDYSMRSSHDVDTHLMKEEGIQR